MRIGTNEEYHLTYCTNIHPASGWDEVLTALRHYAPALKARFAPDRPFGIGLRLSGLESVELLREEQLRDFRAFLDAAGLYVFTLNGFPYGPFHRQAVKADVHAPDWRDEERVVYTLRLVEILAALLSPGMEGSISTSPLSYKGWVDQGDAGMWEHVARNVARVAEALARVRRERDVFIHLDIEPEPDGLLENSREVVRFYEDWLLPVGGQMLADALALPVPEARTLLLDHVRVCFDTCHVAVAYEEPGEVLDRLTAAGIKVGKVQISSALKLELPDDTAGREAMGEALRPFAESTYLHQVVQRNRDGSFHQYPDLSEALPAINQPEAAEWRIHFHVPIFVESYGIFGSTQEGIRRTFNLLAQHPFTRHLEIETYTWAVLPPDLKADLLDSIGREYQWVRDVFV